MYKPHKRSHFVFAFLIHVSLDINIVFTAFQKLHHGWFKIVGYVVICMCGTWDVKNMFKLYVENTISIVMDLIGMVISICGLVKMALDMLQESSIVLNTSFDILSCWLWVWLLRDFLQYFQSLSQNPHSRTLIFCCFYQTLSPRLALIFVKWKLVE